MKILYIDTAIVGHHEKYLRQLLGSKNEPVVVLPTKLEGLQCKQYVYKNQEGRKRRISVYLKWIQEIKKIIKKEEPDIVHFLTGDYFNRYFGIGLKGICNTKILMTYHWIKKGWLQTLALRAVSHYADAIVVHSEYLKDEVLQKRISNVAYINYPMLEKVYKGYKESKEYWGFELDIPVIACIGNTRYDKGLDICLEALKGVRAGYQLLIAGKPDAFDEDYVREKTKHFSNRIVLRMKYLNDEELGHAFSCSDIIVLPYRNIFNGASGPLCEGAYLKKCIIGSDYGNLGDTIKRNHLGYVFDSENAQSLAEVLETALTKKFEVDKKYMEYRKSIQPNAFSCKYDDLYQNI